MDVAESEKVSFEKRFDEIVDKKMYDDLSDVIDGNNCVTEKGRAFIREAERRGKEELPKEKAENDAKLKKVLDAIAAMDDAQVAEAFAKAESDNTANIAAVSSGDFQRGVRQYISEIVEKCREDVKNGQF